MHAGAKSRPTPVWGACLGWPVLHVLCSCRGSPASPLKQRSCSQLHQRLCHLGGLALSESADGSSHVSILSPMTAKIINRVVFLQGNPATEQHRVTFLWMGSAQCVAHGLFKGLFGAEQFRLPRIKRDPRLSILFSLYTVSFNKYNFQRYFIVSKCLSYSDHHRAASPGTKETFPVSLYGHCLQL